MQKTTLFVAACCRWPHSPDTAQHVEATAASIRDWDDARQAVERHRVAPLVHLAVKDLPGVPEDFREWARQRARATAQHAMRLAHECGQIDRAFKAAGLEPVHFKGPVLAEFAYGSVALKHSRDLDIFVKDTDVGAAVAILEGAGYRALVQDTPVGARQIAALVRNFKDLGFAHPNGTLVEIHWRFTYNKGLLGGLENALQRQSVTLANTANLHTFGPAQMLNYLSVHGAIHHWARLKWLADLAAFLEQLAPDERSRIIAQISAGPNSDALAQALQMCDTLLGTDYAPHMSRRAQALCDYSLARIDRPFIPTTNFWGDIGHVGDAFALRHLYATPWAAIRALRGHLFGLRDVMSVPLPAYLNGLYPVIRLPSLLLRRLRG